MSEARAPDAIPPPTRLAQARASDPATSAWVSANAGSGKTHVLVQRVLRLLLTGVPPARILCLTFTKAAAANMAGRVFATLADWTSFSDEALAQEIVAAGAPAPDAARLDFARRLFARTIETPGGLKIQTIHAFCERLLHLFPFEANVAAGFRVVEEREAALMLERAKAEALSQALASPEGAAHLAAIAREAGAAEFDHLLAEALGQRAEIGEALEASGGAQGYGAALCEVLGLQPHDSAATIQAEMLAGLGGRARWPDLAAQLELGSKTDNDRAGDLRAALAAPEGEAALQAYLRLFFVKSGEPRGGKDRALVTKPLGLRFPGLLARLQEEQDRLIAALARLRAARTLERSVALIGVAQAILAAYARFKNARGVLDFDDLIARTLALLSRSDAAWVLYKLDSGIDHILVDEAQDTSREQWDILTRLSEDFTSGASARETPRTFFAVGDQKQSIFSFQGAAPAMFALMRRHFEKRHADRPVGFSSVSLSLSFRSAAAVLEGVDRIFGVADTWRGVAAGDEPPEIHTAFRRALPGLVEIWEPIAGAPAPPSEDWRMPLDAATGADPPVALARRIAAQIKAWLSPASPERVHPPAGPPRAIAPGDVMILVRARGAFFEAMVRALRAENVRAAGADRLVLGQHIAVMDLVSAGRAALLADDDLALACVLKSPLIGLDDNDLLTLAPLRRDSLATALRESPEARFVEAQRAIDAWRKRAAGDTPFSFYARLLGEDGGRRKILARLGPEASDALDEFLALALAHEQNDAPSLHAFLAEIEAADIAIKRDMEGHADSVRVMTVHAAKGLEAPIVFLPDTCSAPGARHDPKLFALAARAPGDPPLIAWSPSAGADPPVLAAARTASQAAAAGEHRRLLYVAMTRAAERLIIAGHHGARGRQKDCWYDMALAGLEGVARPCPAPWDASQTVLRLGEAGRGAESAPVAQAAPPVPTPPWLFAPATKERADAALRPSRATPLKRPDFPDASRREAGRLRHALLQYLPDVAPEARGEAAQRFLDSRAPWLASDERSLIAGQALRVIGHPDLRILFGSGSRAEVSVCGALPGAGRAVPFVGRIDRLAVAPDAVIVADFKSGRPSVAQASESYVAQLALYQAALAPLYPGRPLRALLIWLDAPDIVEIEPAALERAMERLMRAR